MLQVRLANLHDAADQTAIVALLDMYCRDEFGDERPLSETARQNLIPGLQAHGGAKVFLAFAEDAAVGLAICFVGFSSFRGQPLINVHDLAVRPDQRGQGVGRALLTAIDAEARQMGCCRVTLEVRSDNLRAQQLYANVGYRASEPQSWFWTKTL